MALHTHALYAAGLAGRPHALGGGLPRFLIHLLIWRLAWHAGLVLWRIPVFGSAVFVLLALAVVTLILLRSRRGRRWLGRDKGGAYGYGTGTGTGPRDW